MPARLSQLARRLVPLALAVLCGAAAAAPEQRYIVHFRAGQMAAGERATRARAQALRHRFVQHGVVVAELGMAAAAALARDPAVASIERDPPRSPVSMIRSRPSGADTPSATSTDGTASAIGGQVVPYGVSMIQAGTYPSRYRSAVRVCVIDSGYDLGHEDAPGVARITGSDDIGGAGYWNRDALGHGTHVSGTINARNNAIGVVGVFPGAPLHIVRVFGGSGDWTYSSDLVAALGKCRAAGARIVNMSLGGAESSVLERNAFAAARDAGVLLVAAAGNDGNSASFYPASYDSVVSVSALDANYRHAAFANRNAQVDLAAPGVSVLSTVPRGTVRDALLRSDLGSVAVEPMDNFTTPTSPVTGSLVDCGLAATAAACGNASGAVCLIERGIYTFAVKSLSCVNAGGIAAVVYNAAGTIEPVYGTLGGTFPGIPVVGTDRATGLSLRRDQLGRSVSLEFRRITYDYDYYSGTSMAAPHVAGAAAQLWSTHPGCTVGEVRAALTRTARDLGTPGRDNNFGFGLVQVRAASRYLDRLACGGG